MSPDEIHAIALEVRRMEKEEAEKPKKRPARVPEYLRLWDKATSAQSTKEDRKALNLYHQTHDMSVISPRAYGHR